MDGSEYGSGLIPKRGLPKAKMSYRDRLDRAQRISAEVNQEMPDADLGVNFAEYTRRVNNPCYEPRDWDSIYSKPLDL